VIEGLPALLSLSSGGALATTPAGNGTAPQAQIHTIANILAACINTASRSSEACTTLFANAISGGSTGTTATDTATAANRTLPIIPAPM